MGFPVNPDRIIQLTANRRRQEIETYLLLPARKRTSRQTSDKSYLPLYVPTPGRSQFDSNESTSKRFSRKTAAVQVSSDESTPQYVPQSIAAFNFDNKTAFSLRENSNSTSNERQNDADNSIHNPSRDSVYFDIEQDIARKKSSIILRFSQNEVRKEERRKLEEEIQKEEQALAEETARRDHVPARSAKYINAQKEAEEKNEEEAADAEDKQPENEINENFESNDNAPPIDENQQEITHNSVIETSNLNVYPKRSYDSYSGGGEVYVHGYWRRNKNGGSTYVRSHTRRAPRR